MAELKPFANLCWLPDFINFFFSFHSLSVRHILLLSASIEIEKKPKH